MVRRRKSVSFVAIVDDDDGVRESVAGLLNSVGLKTRTFASAEAYLQLHQGVAVACLILDMRLPGMSGLELQRLLQARGSGPPTIFLTAEDDADGRLRTQMKAAGAVAVLRKPCDPDDLTRLVQANIDARHLG